MAIHLPTRVLVIMVIALLILVIAMAALMTANGLTIPLFDQIANLFKGLSPTEVG